MNTPKIIGILITLIIGGLIGAYLASLVLGNLPDYPTNHPGGIYGR